MSAWSTILALVCLISCLLAEPSPIAKCKATTTFSASFDHLPTADNVPSPFGGLRWASAFYVVNASDFSSTVHAHSGSNVAVLPVEGCSLSQVYDNIANGNVTFQFKELYFACTTINFDTGFYEATNCLIQVVAEIDDTVTQGNVTTYGPFKYDVATACDATGQKCRMIKAKIAAPAEILYFNVISSQAGNTALLLDSLVYANADPDCA